MAKILVVDDSKSIRSLIKSLLDEEEVFDVFSVSNGREALEYIKNNQVDLITLDVEMPELTGFETCKLIREYELQKGLAQLPIVFLTSNDTAKDRISGFEVGATQFLSKSFVENDLVLVINQILNPDLRYSELKILVVDDSHAVRAAIKGIAKEMTSNILEASDGEAAFEILKTTKVDLIITDLHMPNMNGDVLCQKVRNELSYKSLPILILTADSKPETALQMFKSGASDYVTKPFIKEELISLMQVHLNTRILNENLKKSFIRQKELNELSFKLLSVCSHDLRTPVNGILGLADFISDNNLMPEEHREHLNYIKVSAKYLSDLVGSLLDISQAHLTEGEVELESITIYKSLESTVNSLQMIAKEKGISLELQAFHEEGFLWKTNELAIKRVVSNLLHNALKFTPSKGTITVISKIEGVDLKIIVQDNGVGIPEKDKETLFEEFSSGRMGLGNEVSSGLGLFIVKQLVERINGEISVESKEGKGTTFTILLRKD